MDGKRVKINRASNQLPVRLVLDLRENLCGAWWERVFGRGMGFLRGWNYYSF